MEQTEIRDHELPQLGVGEILKKSLQFILPFKYLLLLTLLFNTIFSTLSTISISLINPVFGILFSADSGLNKTQSSVLGSTYQKFYEWVYSFVLDNNPVNTLINLSILIIGVFVLKNFFKYIASILSTNLEENIIKLIRDKIFSRLMNLSVEFYSKSRQGNLISIITNDVGILNSTTVASFSIILRETIQIILSLFLLLSISQKLTLIAFSTSIISLGIIRLSVKYLRKYAHRMQAAMSDSMTTVQESISGIRVIKAYVSENIIIDKFKNETKRYVASAFKNSRVANLIPGINEVSAIGALCVVLYVGGKDVLIDKSFRGQDLMTFLFALFSIMSPISTTLNTITGLQRGLISGRRIFSIIDADSTVVNGSEKLDNFKDKISVENISFSYNSEREVLKKINFTLHKGKKIAFVGLSGSGKSTMLDLLIRFYDPTNGEIQIDGKNIRNYDITSYRSLFGIVSQETMLFNDTIENNVRYGKQNINEENINKALEIANAKDFIERNKNGVKTFIGDRGVTLSGGERQRVAIARAIVREPEILIFDEATSALDPKNEKEVQKGINKALENRTAVIVAHRLSTIMDCDEILVFEDGEIKERGKHEDLISLEGIYHKLYMLQFKTNS